ncbi:hypothetical protein FRC0411_00065 [Corynebacterium diphtheriae]|nr:hypothetical protein FRC0411_00065 [Corynebacterium diphtheriae]CAB0933992.1 hypothetical protein FRC0475_00007 [Corynebacterium diphtheriae]CAB0972477.1 hypothetical protein FRC0478_02132 [Corynebacterium diphtheriae]CAB0980427.1 hypothetical protein FRC0492_00007 [Corynebacterium diphtheriae]CAB0991026.1 hypothetical protein FRC0524_00007 [Corynebacterium diphtheriae]
MNIAVVSGRIAPELTLPGLNFSRAYAPSTDFRSARLGLLTGQYPQRQPVTRFASLIGTVAEDFSPADVHIIERAEITPELITQAHDSNAATCFVGHPTIDDHHVRMSLLWPGVTDTNLPHDTIDGVVTCNELVSTLDIAPTLAAIAGYDVRPNAQLSFDGMNLTPVIRYGATGHGGLFFDDGTVITPTEVRRQANDPEWSMWHQFMNMGPLQ